MAGYVVYYCEHLRDGTEEGAKCFDALEEALAFLNKARNDWFAADNHTFRLFELGREVRLLEETVEESQPPRVVRRSVVAVPPEGSEPLSAAK